MLLSCNDHFQFQHHWSQFERFLITVTIFYAFCVIILTDTQSSEILISLFTLSQLHSSHSFSIFFSLIIFTFCCCTLLHFAVLCCDIAVLQWAVSNRCDYDKGKERGVENQMHHWSKLTSWTDSLKRSTCTHLYDLRCVWHRLFKLDCFTSLLTQII